jgi:hypothetical protein
MEHPKDIGDRSTLAVMLALRAADYAVYVPFGENTRCDLVIDDGVALARVQCKTGRLRNGAVVFKTCSSYMHHPHPKMPARDYVGQVDFFGVYCPDTARVYLVPIGDLTSRWKALLRVEPARNSQQKRIHHARPYELGRVDFATAGPGARAGASGSSA